MNAVKLSFTILAAVALSLDVSRASSHRSKTDNRSGYILRRGSIQSATASSVASGLKAVRLLPTAYRSLRAILRSPLLNAFDAELLPLARLKHLDIIKPLTSQITSRSSEPRRLNIIVLVTSVCAQLRARIPLEIFMPWTPEIPREGIQTRRIIPWYRMQRHKFLSPAVVPAFSRMTCWFCWFSWRRIILKQMFLSLGWATDWAAFA